MNFRKSTRIAFITAALSILAASTVSANSSDDEIRLLREQIMALSARLDQLEASNRDLRETNEQNTAALAAVNQKTDAVVAGWEDQVEAISWTDTLRWKGDFRYRFENIDVEGVDDRNRSRIRARAALVADIYDDLEVGIGLASGSEDPVSSNQTLGGGGSTKDLRLDLAYFDWKGLSNTHILGGKMKNIIKPVGKNSMLWDTDWRPEGTAFTWDNETFYVGAVGTWLESDSRKGNNFAWLGEAGFRLKFGENVKMRLGLGYHEFDVKGRESVFRDGDFFGNSFVEIPQADGGTLALYRYDYHGIEVSGELGFKLGDFPMLAFADYVQNQEAGEYDTGYIFGLKLGSAKAPGSWDVSWAWEDLEADAALGLLVDSDFGGGGTDARGHILKGTYVFKKNFSFKATYFINEIDGDLGTEKDFNRLMMDLNFKF